MLINGAKYACETCIKGHRTSTCKHSDRQLVEIKKKGRPQTQCDHCRELRKVKQVHVKCLCVTTKGDTTQSSNSESLSSESSPNSISPSPETQPSCAQGPECPCCLPRKRPSTKRNKNLSKHPDVKQPSSQSNSDSEKTSDGVFSVDLTGPLHSPSSGTNNSHIHHSSFSPYQRAYSHHHHEMGIQQEVHNLISDFSVQDSGILAFGLPPAFDSLLDLTPCQDPVAQANDVLSMDPLLDFMDLEADNSADVRTINSVEANLPLGETFEQLLQRLAASGTDSALGDPCCDVAAVDAGPSITFQNVEPDWLAMALLPPIEAPA